MIFPPVTLGLDRQRFEELEPAKEEFTVTWYRFRLQYVGVHSWRWRLVCRPRRRVCHGMHLVNTSFLATGQRYTSRSIITESAAISRPATAFVRLCATCKRCPVRSRQSVSKINLLTLNARLSFSMCSHLGHAVHSVGLNFDHRKLYEGMRWTS